MVAVEEERSPFEPSDPSGQMAFGGCQSWSNRFGQRDQRHGTSFVEKIVETKSSVGCQRIVTQLRRLPWILMSRQHHCCAVPVVNLSELLSSFEVRQETMVLGVLLQIQRQPKAFEFCFRFEDLEIVVVVADVCPVAKTDASVVGAANVAVH
jgi:hypothetical protein